MHVYIVMILLMHACMHSMRVVTTLQNVVNVLAYVCECTYAHRQDLKTYTKAQPVGLEIHMHSTACQAACARLACERVCTLTLCIVCADK